MNKTIVFLLVFIMIYLTINHLNKKAINVSPINEIIVKSPPTIVNPTPPTASEPSLPEKPTTYEEALAIAKKFDKKILLMFSSTSCPPCQKMKNTTLKNENIKKTIEEKYVFFLMEDDNDDIFRKYMIFATPSYRIITADEKILKKSMGYMDINLFSKFLSE